MQLPCSWLPLTHHLYSGVPNFISGSISQFPELLAQSHMHRVARSQQGTVFELTPTCIHCLGVQHGWECAAGTWALQSLWICPPCLQYTVISEGILCQALSGSCRISYLADSSATCQGPVATTTVFVPMSDHSHNLLGVTPEGNTTLGAAGHLCHLGKQTEQSRNPALLNAGGKVERRGNIAGRNELVLCPLLPAALDPTGHLNPAAPDSTDRSLEP